MKVCVFHALCTYLPSAHFRVAYIPDGGELLGVDLYRDALSAYAGRIDGLLGEDMQLEMSDEQLRVLGRRVSMIECEEARHLAVSP